MKEVGRDQTRNVQFHIFIELKGPGSNPAPSDPGV